MKDNPSMPQPALPDWRLIDRLISLPGAAIKIYVALCQSADGPAPRTCRASYSTLAKRAGLCRNTVISSIRLLEDAGLIGVERPDRPERDHSPNTYTIRANEALLTKGTRT